MGNDVAWSDFKLFVKKRYTTTTNNYNNTPYPCLYKIHKNQIPMYTIYFLPPNFIYMELKSTLTQLCTAHFISKHNAL